jgi:hypothetical protein
MSEEAKVSELTNPHTKNWNTSMILELFIEEEARTICNIPLSPLQPKDQMVWRSTNNGHFSIRSAYYLTKAM